MLKTIPQICEQCRYYDTENYLARWCVRKNDMIYGNPTMERDFDCPMEEDEDKTCFMKYLEKYGLYSNNHVIFKL